MTMNNFQRIKESESPETSDGYHGDVRVSNAGFCWRKQGERWLCEGFLPDPGGRLIDSTNEPQQHQGKAGDAAVSPAGLCWKKTASGWGFERDLVNQKLQDLSVNRLRIEGNFVPTLVDGKIPVYRQNPDGSDTLEGYLELKKYPFLPPSVPEPEPEPEN